MERRRHPRVSVSWRIRFWLNESLGFIDGDAVNASSGGLGLVLSARLSSHFLTPGMRYTVDLEAGGEPVLREQMTVRHATGGRIGLAFEQDLPLVAILERLESSA